MSLNDRFKVIDYQTYQGKEVTNVYWYQQISSTGSAEKLVDAFIATMLPALLTIQNLGVEHYQVEALNFDNEADFHSEGLTTSNTGSRTGDGLPSFVAWGFKLNRPTRAIRSGAKRVVGVSESDQNNGVVAAGFDDDVANVADVMASVIGDTELGEYQPQIVTISPLTGLIINDVGINSASYMRITSQNSRKD